MTTIDFTRIRSTPKSRHDSFEALSVQLFRKCTEVPPGSNFISLRGDGGDGGVEAYFRTPDGDFIGVQAKYFFKLEAAELRQIDDSLQEAIKNHPALKKYYVYIPFDLTGRKSAGTRGKGQSERYEDWKSTAETKAATSGSPVEIVLCTAATIRAQLLDVDSHGGVRRYWFDEDTLTSQQIEQLLSQARAFAGPRYSATLDVTTNAHIGLDIFGGVSDYKVWFSKSVAPELSAFSLREGRAESSLNILPPADIVRAQELIESTLLDLKKLAVDEPGDTGQSTLDSLKELSPLLTTARRAQEAEFKEKHGEEADSPGWRQFQAEYMVTFPAAKMDEARARERACSALIEALNAPEFKAGNTRTLLITGPAGIGKTHAIVSAAYRRLPFGGMSIVTFGEDFDDKEPWEVLRSKFGFGSSMPRAELFDSLESCAESTALPFVIFIDALNESSNKERWKRRLPEFLEQIKPYPNIKVCFSTRDTYFSQVIDSTLQRFSFQHVGFIGNEFLAVQAFAEHYGLNAEITPLFSVELRNPLFLHLMCKTLKEQGKTTLDMSLPGLTALIESHLKKCDELVRSRINYVNPRNLVRAATLALAKILVESDFQHRTWDVCAAALRNIAGSHEKAESLLKELEHEGLVIITIDAEKGATVRMGYQRYGDTLRALHSIEACTKDGELDISKLSAYLRTIGEADEGLLESIAVVLPEKHKIEIVDSRFGLGIERANRAYVHSLTWRSRDSFESDTGALIYGVLAVPNLWEAVYEAMFSLCLVPNHRLNADNWWRNFLGDEAPVKRDVFLSLSAVKSFDENGAMRSLINSALQADISRWPQESQQLAAQALGWLTSCTDRRIRDMSGKALTRLISYAPHVGTTVAGLFTHGDDDYVREYVSLAIYSACLLNQADRAKYVPALNLLLHPTWLELPNVLIRDTIQLLASVLDAAGLLNADHQKLLSNRPKQLLPEVWPTIDNAKPLLELENLPLNMKLWGDSMGTDFWRYQVESKIYDFDLEAAGITHENIACWIMVETLRQGYPGDQKVGLKMDRMINGRYGGGRGREGYADRLGKKYYWIALHRLLGILSDNIPTKQQFSEVKHSKDRLWSLDVRKVDLTDVRDIFPEKIYPDEIIHGGRYPFPPQVGDMKNWVRTIDFSPHDICLSRFSHDGTEWVPLWFSARDNDRPDAEISWNEPYLNVDLFYKSIFIQRKSLSATTLRDMPDLAGHDCNTYRGYFGEFPAGRVYEQLSDEGSMYLSDGALSMGTMSLLRGNEWEYDYSCIERPENFDVPNPNLLMTLELTWDKQRGWVNTDGELVAFASKVSKRSAVFIRRVDLNLYLLKTDNHLTFRCFANKGLIDTTGNTGAQIDINTFILYTHHHAPEILRVKNSSFNC